MPKTRILVVDDSVVARRMLSDVLSEDPDLEVVGVAPSGRTALMRIPQLNPDIITLDVEMPDMDGLETLQEIRRSYPKLPVIMVSAVTEHAADLTLRALSLGATDYVTKPTAQHGSAPRDQLREQLLPKVRGLAIGRGPRALGATAAPAAPVRRFGDVIKAVPPRTPPTLAPVAPAAAVPARVLAVPHARAGSQRVDILAIGSSTGGPNALAAIVPRLSAGFHVPVVITQHMPPLFTRLLAERLDSGGALRVHEARGGEALEPGHVYIAPGDYHMEVKREGTSVRLVLQQAPPENSCRPSVDVMIRSVTSTYGAGTLALILTGMGQDGLRGCEWVREAGGVVLAQDEPTSVVWGMPGAVTKAGLADAVLPLEAIASDLMRRVFVGAGALAVARRASPL
jgi:two-component system chemotaxis response regulator CheB